MTDFLLIIHILSAAAWIGGGFLSAFVGPRMGRNPAPGVALGWARVAAEAGASYFNGAGILTGLSGIGLVITSEVYDWSDTFVSIGLGVVIAAGLIGGFVHRPGGGRLVAALENGDQAGAAAEAKRGAIWSAITAVLLIVAVIVMVLKTGVS